MKEFLEIGKVVSTHGLQGELKIYPWCDSASDICGLKTLYLDEQGAQSLKIRAARTHKNMALVQFCDWEDIGLARKLIDRVLFASRAELTLEDGAFFIADLIGLTAVDADNPGLVYGFVSDYTDNGAHGIFHVKRPDGRVFMVPNVNEMVPEIHIESGTIIMKPVEGLIDDAN